jgi:hypothetical protein
VYKAVDEDLAKFGGSSMMTEGLACSDDKRAGCEMIMDQLDLHLQSWTDYGDSQGEKFSPTTSQQASWARTYARAIGGRPLNTSFDVSTKRFEMCFDIDPSVHSPPGGGSTEIFASIKYTYPNGCALESTKNLVLKGTNTIPGAGRDRPSAVVFLVEPAAVGTRGGACVWVAPK